MSLLSTQRYNKNTADSEKEKNHPALGPGCPSDDPLPPILLTPKEGDRCGCGGLGGNGGTGGTFLDMCDTSDPLLDGAGEPILEGASKY
jgi:hypothetical protein